MRGRFFAALKNDGCPSAGGGEDRFFESLHSETRALMRIALNFRANVLEGGSPCRRGTVGSAEASRSDALQDSARK